MLPCNFSIFLRPVSAFWPAVVDLADQPGQARVWQADAGGAADQACAETAQRRSSAQWWNTHIR